MGRLVGRIKELAILEALKVSDKSEFAAVYGRRRVGKTFMIRTAFSQKFTFQVTGLGNASITQQLANFDIALQKTDKGNQGVISDNWQLAFQYLINYLERCTDSKKTIFIDELPWFDTPKSGFIQSLEHFWNSWASARNDVILIACGSAASWMINTLINNKGGLHNRVTKRIKVLPFTLYECEKLLESRKIVLDRYQIIQLYMAFGGIPFYWDEVKAGQSAAQNIEEICFSENGLLRNEFTNLYASLFSNYERHMSIVNALAQKAKGLTRDEIISLSGLANAGSTTRLIDELIESGFITKYTPFGKKSRNSFYQLTDFYTLFYFRFIKNMPQMDQNTWINSFDSPQTRTWSGYAFEQVCLYHLPQIKHALGISGIQSSVSSWLSITPKQGAQIDLLIDRRDQVITVCEMKFSVNPYLIEKKYADDLRKKISIFKSETKTRKSIFLCMVTTFGVEPNIHSIGLMQNNISMDALFAF